VRFIHNSRNLLSAAVLAATNTRSSSALRRTAVSRTGNGVIGLSGPYTGTDETDIDIEITAGAGAERITGSRFVGVGTGELSDAAVSPGATPQQYTVTLIDRGTTTAAAEVDIEGVTLTAQSAGAGGNAINLEVDQTGLTFTATDYSLLEELPEDTTEITGPGWDWDTAVGIGDEIPSTAKRIAIGNDRSVIYRQWKTYKEGAWVYRFLPAIARTYKAGERVYEVTGSRSVTLTDGVSPENYSNIVTLYDLLAEIRDGSDLVAVDGVISDGATVDNPAAVVDLRTRTDAHVAWTAGSGSEYARGFINYNAGAAAKTEIITAKCHANKRADGGGLGRERWTLKGSVSGELGHLVTGEAYPHPAGRFTLTIPTRLPDGYDDVPRGDISADIDYASRGDGETEPPICVDRLRLGPNAEDRSIRFVYQARPADTCPCEDTPWTRLPKADECLYLDPTEEIDMTDLAAGHAARISDTQRWHSDFVQANTEIDSTNKELFSALHDIALADGIRAVLLQCLARIYLEGTLSWAAWAVATAITQYEVREPSTPNGYKYRAQNAGTTHASTEPTWPTTIGNTETDNGITWECIGKTPEQEFDDLLSAVDTELSALEAIETNYADFESVPLWSSANTWTRGDIIRETLSSTTETVPHARPLLWVCIDGGTGETHGATGLYYPGGHTGWNVEPTYGKVTTDNQSVWLCLGKLPFWSSSDINRNSAPGRDAADNGIGTTVDGFLRRYAVQADFVVAAAELTPDFNSASTTGTLPGGACWRDTGDSFWWVPEGTALMPASTNQEYVSVQASADPDQPPVPTHEFGMVIKVDPDCIGYLQEGDSVTIQIGDAGWPATYQVGDELHLATLAAAPLYLGGGVTGTDTYTWQIDRSVDGLGTDYSQDLAIPALYSDGDVEFRINAGGIAHALGDYFVFCVEDSTFKWRQDGGTWSGNLDIAQTALADGLKAEFTEGNCPSFVAGDTISYTALQPYAVGQAATPDDQVFAWTGSGTVITATVTGTVDAIMLARHTLPSGSTVNVQDGASLNQNITWSAGPMVLLLDTPLTNPTLTITVTATDAEIGWLWAGEILSTDRDPVHSRSRRYDMTRGAGINPSAGLNGRGRGYRLDYQGLSAAEFDDLVDQFEDLKADGDAPLCLVIGDADAADLVRLPDEIDYDDFLHWAEGASDRAISLTVECAPWLTLP
jgi:hypothetical protein